MSKGKFSYIPKLLKSDLKVVLDGGLPWAEAVKSSELALMTRQRLFMFCQTSLSQISGVWSQLERLGPLEQQAVAADAG